MSYISIVMKITRLCNLRCSYCHDWRSGPNNSMGFEVLAKTIASALADTSNRVVEFVWHGGEPTLFPISYYQKILFMQSKFKRKNQIVINRLQTNGTRINLEWASFFKDSNFVLGISIDGPPILHNQQRIFSNGKGSFDKVIESIRLLQEKNIPFKVLMVVDEMALELGAASIFNFFNNAKINNYGVIAATPIIKPQEKDSLLVEHYVDTKRFTDFLIELYNCWIDYGDTTIRIRELDDIVRLLYSSKLPQSCKFQGECFGNYYVVEPNGQIAHCELFQGDSEYILGNIINTDFESTKSSKQILKLKEENQYSLNNMKSCNEFETCKGWCPHERYLSKRHNDLHNPNCCGLSDLISYIRNNPPPPVFFS